LTAGGELSGFDPVSHTPNPALTVCTNETDALSMLTSGRPASGSCNLGILVIFNSNSTNCTSNPNFGCESNRVNAGDYIVADRAVNPGYTSNQAVAQDKDIGLLHLVSDHLSNGSVEPSLLTFNRAGLGASCGSLGNLRFVGYGITTPVTYDTQGNPTNSPESGVKYNVSHQVKVKDPWHTEEDGPNATAWGATCGNGTGSEPTCEGDSGGPAFNANGEIVAVTSLGDQNCSDYGQDTRVDFYASWIDSTMTASNWGDPVNGSGTSSTTGTSTTSTSSTSTSTGTTGTTGQTCQQCAATAETGVCATQTQACSSNSACVALSNCLNGCSDQTCANTCATNNQAGVAAYQAFVNCIVNTACPTECGGSSSATSTTGTTGTTGVSGTTGTTGTTGTAVCQSCVRDTDCGAGGACAYEAQGAQSGYCAPACNSAGGCDDASATCGNIFGDGSLYCYPSGGCSAQTSTTSAGTSGSTGTTGTGQTCQQCATAAESGICATQTQACGSNSACVALSNCINACADQTCANTCATNNQAGVAAYQTFVNCIVNTACPTECGGSSSATSTTGTTGVSGTTGTSSTIGTTTGTIGSIGTIGTTGLSGTATTGTTGSVGTTGLSGTGTTGTTSQNTVGGSTGATGATVTGGTTGTPTTAGTTGGTTAGSTGTAAGSTGGTAAGSTGTTGAHTTGATATNASSSTGGTGTSAGTSAGGCSSTDGAGLMALFALVPMLSRRRRLS
jgi:uncharacterized protein (TIGR03382 family)